MIHFYATGRHTYTVSRFLQRWAPELASEVTLHSYSSIDLSAALPPGLHVLTDFERLIGPERGFVSRLRTLLRSRPETHVVLGTVDTWLSRHELLQALHARGINDFRSFPFRDADERVRYPVLLRWANEHGAPLGDPAYSRAELEARVRQHVGRRIHVMARHLLVVEMVDVRSPDGLYRKYAVMRIGDRLVPRHVFFSHDWFTKVEGVVAEAQSAEELAFVRDFEEAGGFPHAEQVSSIFDLAGMDYGRIDYSVVDGRLRVWEINSNPMLGAADVHAGRVESQTLSAAWTIEALRALVPTGHMDGAPLLWPRTDRARWAPVQALGRRYDPHRR